MKKILFFILCLLSTLACSEKTVKYISADKIPEEAFILDVRTNQEVAEMSIKKPFTHIPMGNLDINTFKKQHLVKKSTPIYILCRSGKQARYLADKFILSGFSNIYVVQGGILAINLDDLDIN